MPALPIASEAKSIRLADGFKQWKEVAPEFSDHLGETIPRDFNGVAGLHYTNGSGRNDLAAFKVARDKKNVFFYARSGAPLTSSKDTHWMWLLIDTDRNARTGWEGYDFIVNRSMEGDGKTWLEKNVGGWNWKKVALVQFRAEGNELQLAIPRTALGLDAGTTAVNLDFKWADNIRLPGDITDFYISGDVAPDARFNYRYVAE
jgi:hypothetical protein